MTLKVWLLISIIHNYTSVRWIKSIRIIIYIFPVTAIYKFINYFIFIIYCSNALNVSFLSASFPTLLLSLLIDHVLSFPSLFLSFLHVHLSPERDESHWWWSRLATTYHDTSWFSFIMLDILCLVAGCFLLLFYSLTQDQILSTIFILS